MITNQAVNQAVYWDVEGAVYTAVDEAVSRYMNVYNAVYWAVEGAVLTTDKADDHQAVLTQWDAWGGV